jgi:diguanylate cyclase (GGDEF)-like protein
MAVEALHIQHDGQPLGQVTISIGVATFPEHGTTAAALIHAADTALYQAKARGRNCVCVANRETQVPTTDHSMLSGEDR